MAELGYTVTDLGYIQGDSAYQVWLQQSGNAGKTVQEYLTDITGASIISAEFDGDDIRFEKNDANTVVLADAKNELKGPKGDTAGAPKGAYANLAALQAANPNRDNVYLTNDDGIWCYWNGAVWASGKVYASPIDNYVFSVHQAINQAVMRDLEVRLALAEKKLALLP